MAGRARLTAEAIKAGRKAGKKYKKLDFARKPLAFYLNV
jgi:hypothetical protein